MSETSFIKRFDITLDLKQPGCGGDFSVVDGDTGNVVYLALTDAGVPVSVEGRRIIAAFSNSRGKYMQDSAESGGGISISDDKVKLQLRPQSFAPGIVECELQIYSGGTENSAAGATVYDSLLQPQNSIFLAAARFTMLQLSKASPPHLRFPQFFPQSELQRGNALRAKPREIPPKPNARQRKKAEQPPKKGEYWPKHPG